MAATVFLFLKIPEAAKPTEASLKEKFLQMDLLGVAIIISGVICLMLSLSWEGVQKT